MTPTGDLARNPGMCPDWELNLKPFGSQAGTQSTEPPQPGLDFTSFQHSHPFPTLLLHQQMHGFQGLLGNLVLSIDISTDNHHSGLCQSDLLGCSWHLQTWDVSDGGNPEGIA